MTTVVTLAVALGVPASAAAWPGGSLAPDTPDQRIVYPSTGPGSAAVVGDVNGDGLDDIAAVAGQTTYVTFSRAQGGTIDATGPGGFAITMAGTPSDVAAVGDVDGDGRRDVAVMGQDSLRVIFGKADDAPVDADDLGARGFTVTGGAQGPYGGGIAGVGDLNGDGRGDFLVATPDGAALIYPPAGAAGTTIDVSATGAAVARIYTRTGYNSVGTIGDQNGDGRADLLVGGVSGDNSITVYGLSAPWPGEAVDGDDLLARGLAFRLVEPPADRNAGITARPIGDANGDGRADVALTEPDFRVVYSPAFGSAVDVSVFGWNDAGGHKFFSSVGDPIDVGDQNDDGVDDWASRSYVHYTPPRSLIGGSPLPDRSVDYTGTIVGPVADLNGDGKAELAFKGYDNHAIDVFDSVPRPRVSLFPSTKGLIDPAGYLTTSVDAVTGAGHQRGGGPLSVAAAVEVASPDKDGKPMAFEGRSWFLTASPTEHLEMRGHPSTPEELSLVPGERYRFRVGIYTPRAGEFWSVWQTFTYRGPKGIPWFQPPDPAANVALAIVLRGTARRNRITGTAKNERIFGLGGDDRINGAGGDDFIDGGSGNDTLIGGTGNDVLIGGGGTDKFSAGAGDDWINAFDGHEERVDCGVGTDSVVADPHDRLRGCERVRRER